MTLPLAARRPDIAIDTRRSGVASAAAKKKSLEMFQRELPR